MQNDAKTAACATVFVLHCQRPFHQLSQKPWELGIGFALTSRTFSWRHKANHTTVALYLLAASGQNVDSIVRWRCGQKIQTDYLVVSAVIKVSPAWIKELNYIFKEWQSGRRTVWHNNKYCSWREVWVLSNETHLVILNLLNRKWKEEHCLQRRNDAVVDSGVRKGDQLTGESRKRM